MRDDILTDRIVDDMIAVINSLITDDYSRLTMSQVDLLNKVLEKI